VKIGDDPATTIPGIGIAGSPQQNEYQTVNNDAATDAAIRQSDLSNQADAQKALGNISGYYNLTGQAFQALGDYFRSLGQNYSGTTYQSYVSLANFYESLGSCYVTQSASGTAPSC
jgi:hypothetical protein